MSQSRSATAAVTASKQAVIKKGIGSLLDDDGAAPSLGDRLQKPPETKDRRACFQNRQTTKTISFGESTNFLDESRHGEEQAAERPKFAGEPRHGPSRIGRARDWCGWLANSRPVTVISTILTLINAIMLGIMTFDFVQNNDQVRRGMELGDSILLAIFTAELVLQFFYHGVRPLLRNGWLVFDTFIIVFSWAFQESSVTVLRSFRIFRVARIMSRWESLRDLVRAIGKTMPKMATIWAALLILFYVFSVLFTSLYSGLYDEGYLVEWDYFGRLDYTFITLFQFMTLDSWTNVVRQVMEARYAAWLGFFAFVIITSFVVLNLVVAVICEALVEMQAEKTKKHNKRLLQRQHHLITDQTADLLRETTAVRETQKAILENQMELQKAIQQIALALDVPIGAKIGGKSALRDMIHSSQHDEAGFLYDESS